MEIEKLKKLHEKADKDLILNDDNLKQKSLDIGNLLNFYNKLLMQEFWILNKLDGVRESVYGKLYDYYKFSKKPYKDREPFQNCLDSKAEIDVYIKADPDYEEINLKYSNQKAVCQYLTQTLDNIKSMGYQVKNQMEIQRFKTGSY